MTGPVCVACRKPAGPDAVGQFCNLCARILADAIRRDTAIVQLRNDAVIDYLARAVGGVFFRPPVGGEDEAQLGRTVREFGEMLQCHGATLADGRVTADEAERFAREADDVIAAVAALKGRVRARVSA